MTNDKNLHRDIAIKVNDAARERDAVAALLPKGAIITMFSKRPFRVEYTMPNGERRYIKDQRGRFSWGALIKKEI